MKRAFTGLFVLLLLVLPIQAQNKPGPAPVKLAWRFSKGTEFHFRQTQVSKQAVDMGAFGNEETLQKTSFHMKYECEEVNEKSIATLRVTYLRAKLETKDEKGNELLYDSANPDDQSKLSDARCKVVNAYVDQWYNFDVDAAGKVVSVRNYEALQKRVNDATGLPEGSPDQAISENQLKRQLELNFSMLPENEVSKGDTWSRVHKEPAPMLGTFTYEIKCTYKGMKTERGYNAAYVSMESEATLEVEKKEGEPAPVISDLKLTESKLTGSFYFLPTSSQFLKTEIKQHMVITGAVGEITFKITMDVDVSELLLTADDLKVEAAEVKALAEGKKTETPEKEPEKKDTPPVPVPKK